MSGTAPTPPAADAPAAAAMSAVAAAPAPELAIVILSWNTRALLESCLRSLFEQPHGVAFEAVVVDNASKDGSADLVATKFPAVKLLRNGVNEGYARGNNQGVRATAAPLVLLLNSDTEVRPGALAKLCDVLRRFPEYGAAAPRLVNPDGSVQRACMRFPTLAAGFWFDSWFERKWGRSAAVRRYFMEEFDHLGDADVDQPPGAALLVRRADWDAIGGFDETLWLFYNDVEFCRRVHDRGQRIRYVASAEVLHHGGQSTAQYRDFAGEWIANRVRYFKQRHGPSGALVLKSWLLLRGLEEAVRWWRNASGPAFAAGLRDVWRVVKRGLRA
jgi:GT2 family glycosyltransferase